MLCPIILLRSAPVLINNKPGNDIENVAMQNYTSEAVYLRLESICLDSFSHLISVLYVNYFVHD